MVHRYGSWKTGLLTLITGAALAAPHAVAAGWRDTLGSLTAWGVFSRGNLSYTCTEAQGPLGAFGDISLARIKVGKDGVIAKSALVVSGGSLLLRHGSLLGHSVAGANALLSNFDAGHVYAGGRASCIDGTYLSCRGSSEVSSHLAGLRAVEVALVEVSNTLANLPSQTAEQDSAGRLVLRADFGATEIYKITAGQLATAREIVFEGTSESTVVVNVSGASVSLETQTAPFRLIGISPSRVVLNFPQAASLTLRSTSVAGALLAPYADVRFGGGSLEGTLFGRSVEAIPAATFPGQDPAVCNGAGGAHVHVVFRP